MLVLTVNNVGTNNTEICGFNKYRRPTMKMNLTHKMNFSFNSPTFVPSPTPAMVGCTQARTFFYLYWRCTRVETLHLLRGSVEEGGPPPEGMVPSQGSNVLTLARPRGLPSIAPGGGGSK